MLKSTEERKKQKKEEVANAIIDAAIPLIHDRSFTQISIQEFCEMAGITTGMFYRHFKTKNDLLSVFYNRECKHAIDELMTDIKTLSLQEQLIALGTTICKCYQLLGPDGMLMYLHNERGAVDCEESRGDFQSAVETVVENAKANGELLPEGTTVKAVSDDIVLLFKGATFEWYSWRDNFDIEKTFSDVLQRMMPAILGKVSTE